MKLTDYLNEHLSLTNDMSRLLDDLFETTALPKGYELLAEGSKSKKFFYLESGLMRLYYLKEGKDITHFFLNESSIYTPIENVFFNEYYPFNLVLLEDSVIRSIDFSVLEPYVDKDPQLQRLSRFLAVSAIRQLSDQLYSIKFQTAQERYKILLQNYPGILLRVPLGHIASYLGITQQTLSVIRAEYGKS
ncbi:MULTISPECIES: Crp/Fnr family transcriptional regulator [Chryseobacterium]|uniref:CRP-like cAMP-binding protein n=1 Tax=Chryseobacterium camelliae TaxID=1265445 RepID=A0ABU0TDT1_9FLAO|nr:MULTISPECIES: Crp/Fnr family transcriptional regulator [Chryseobacterium]MDT3406973.1 CRP-like cAMP-binding protein [Pseudacidovorax intermedius]MDQ1095234.1 CRP-like cAMP-binding protein [Chryseobacterium camelliae]MDQ1099172.1 CRP-like cAMP-binding protein [Chryseobacterium sp. SORGH_AS_1048]MDR6086521.1 CRP-like cAMP-binding protein [Chryseobacterium sp. SORGH_AS_0909]MDR6130892.1 CRP-like cAMP-binding protein [Chryseobacterium sp. SORGH_AS_1175]